MINHLYPYFYILRFYSSIKVGKLLAKLRNHLLHLSNLKQLKHMCMHKKWILTLERLSWMFSSFNQIQWHLYEMCEDYSWHSSLYILKWQYEKLNTEKRQIDFRRIYIVNSRKKNIIDMVYVGHCYVYKRSASTYTEERIVKIIST